VERFLKVARAVDLGDGPPPAPGAPDPVKEAFDVAVANLAAYPDADRAERAVWYFVRSRLSMSGRQKNVAPPTKTGRRRRGMDERLSSYLTGLDLIPAVHRRLQGVAIECRPALEVIREYDGPGALIYADPPYVASTRAAPQVYGYEMTEADHRELLALLGKCEGRVILSGYPSALYDGELSAWKRHDFAVANHSASGRKKRRMTECVWCNFTPEGGPGVSGVF
jgi:DNA adenine methylase